MSTRDLYGTTRTIPATGNYDWGAQVSGVLEDTCTGLNSISSLLTTIPVLQMLSTSTSVVNGATLTQTHQVHLVAGAAGTSTLDTITPIAASAYNNLLVLIGSSISNAVIIPEGGTNMLINGEMKIVQGSVIMLIYNTTLSKWVELFRNT